MKYRYVNKKWMGKKELIELFKSSIALTIAFTIYFLFHTKTNNSIINTVIITLITITSGFILHELAHKYFAIKFGAQANYQGNDKMLIFAIIGGIIGFIFAAPGAVIIRGQLSKNKYGIVSLAGPLSNFILATIFLGLTIIYPSLALGATVNTWIGAFNLIPIPPFDGQKILRWNKIAYIGMLIIAFIMLMIIFF